MSLISNQVDYKKELFLAPDYKLNRIFQQSGGQTVTLTSGGGNESIFEIPVRSFNLARSHLYMTLTPTAVAGLFNFAWVDCVTPIRQIQLYTRSGIYLCDLSEANTYTKIALKPETKIDEFLEYDIISNTAINTYSTHRYLSRNNTLQDSATITLLAPYAKRPNNTNSDVAYTESKYLESTAAINTAGPVFNVALPLSAYKNTIFALDKDLYMNEIIILRIVWNATNRILFNGDTLANPSANLAAYGAAIAVTNLSLFLASDKNQLLTNQLQGQIMSPEGLKILIPYVYTYKFGSGNATSHSISYRFNRGHGANLIKIFHSALSTAETLNTGYDHDNTGTDKVNQFYTMLDNERLQEYNLDTTTRDDYLYLQPKLKGSVIQSANMFYHNWVWIEDFTGYVDKTKKPGNSDNLVSGLDLSVERKWDFYALKVHNNVAAAYNYYTFAVTQKMLTIASVGITVI